MITKLIEFFTNQYSDNSACKSTKTAKNIIIATGHYDVDMQVEDGSFYREEPLNFEVIASKDSKGNFSIKLKRSIFTPGFLYGTKNIKCCSADLDIDTIKETVLRVIEDEASSISQFSHIYKKRKDFTGVVECTSAEITWRESYLEFLKDLLQSNNTSESIMYEMGALNKIDRKTVTFFNPSIIPRDAKRIVEVSDKLKVSSYVNGAVKIAIKDLESDLKNPSGEDVESIKDYYRYFYDTYSKSKVVSSSLIDQFRSLLEGN